jgi:isoquinoline 1-oxidoreductase subunit beta
VKAFWEPLRRAGATARAMQVAAAADTWKVDPNSCRSERGEVVHPLTGRKLGYGALADKAAKLAVPAPDKVSLKDPRDFKLIGTPAKRLDTPDKVNGKAEYGIDVKIPGMKIATVAACPVIGGKLARLDDTKAKAVKGVHQIVRLDDAVAVVADHMGAAKKGLAALDVTWEGGASAQFTSADMVGALDEASKRPGVIAEKKGDVATAMAGAARTIEAVYHQLLLAHATMEPMNCTVHVRPDGCDIWVGTQVITRAQATAAQVTGLPPDKVQVHNRLLGGGFGRRLDVDGITQAVRIARQVDGPLKVVWTREEDMQHDVYRPYYYDRLAAGLNSDGMPVAFSHRVTGSSILARWFPAGFRDGLDSDAVEGAAGPYDFPNLLIDYVRQEPPAGLTTGWWRGVGSTHNSFMVEGFVDELAAAAGKDPVAYRGALLGKAPRAKGVLDLAAEKAGWGQRPWRFGHPRLRHLCGAGRRSLGRQGWSVRVTRVVCAIDCGRIVNPDTVKAQAEGGTIFGITAALHGEITLKNGRVTQANFDSYEMLRIDEAPAIEVYLVDSTEAPGGMGEPATAAIAPTVVNAVFWATGKRLRKLPIDGAQLKSS